MLFARQTRFELNARLSMGLFQVHPDRSAYVTYNIAPEAQQQKRELVDNLAGIFGVKQASSAIGTSHCLGLGQAGPGPGPAKTDRLQCMKITLDPLDVGGLDVEFKCVFVIGRRV